MQTRHGVDWADAWDWPRTYVSTGSRHGHVPKHVLRPLVGFVAVFVTRCELYTCRNQLDSARECEVWAGGRIKHDTDTNATEHQEAWTVHTLDAKKHEYCEA